MLQFGNSYMSRLCWAVFCVFRPSEILGRRVLRPVSGFCGRLPFEGVRQRLSGRGFTLRGEDCGRSQSQSVAPQFPNVVVLAPRLIGAGIFLEVRYER